MRNLLLIGIVLILASCEQEPIVTPQEVEVEFTVIAGIKDFTSYEVEFPLLTPSATNPLYVSPFGDNYSKQKTFIVKSKSPFIVRAKHFSQSDWIYCKVYKDKYLVASDSLFGKVKEIWITYEWE
jgi:hypothetical protein